MALLHSEPRTATVRAVTPCSLYELRQRDLNASMEAYPVIRRLLEEVDRKRKAELTQG
jgi:CPA1 family monovalent cation:H+ antiporter